MSTLIPLKYACRRLILIGDPNQLPATVFSEYAMKHNYEQSLFQRLQIGGQRVAMLTTQYRMHPQISRFPGRRFYNGALKDAPNMADLTKVAWHEKRILGPYVFYDVADGIAAESSSSWSNEYVSSGFQPASCRSAAVAAASDLPITKAHGESHVRISS